MAKKKTKKAPANVPSEHVGSALTVGDNEEVWGTEEISSEDILIPKILLMQPMSELVTDGIAKIGEFRDSLNKDVCLGGVKDDLEIIPFKLTKDWMEFKGDEYLSTFPMTEANKNLPIEDVTEDGEELKRVRVINIFCLSADQVEQEEAFPYVLRFRGTSHMAGKKLATYFTKAQLKRQPPAAKTYKISSTQTKNDKGTFFVMDVTPGRITTKEEVAVAYEWYQTLTAAQKNNKVKVDEGDETTAKTPANGDGVQAGANA